LEVSRDRVEKVVREVLDGPGADAAAAQGRLTVALGSDHAGFLLKETLKRYMVEELGVSVRDVGPASDAPCDYPDFAALVARLVAVGECQRGIVVDGVGVGSAMAANKIGGVRAACCHDVRTAVSSRSHNDANVLTMGAGVVGRGLARQMVRAWLATEFEGGRHERRVAKISDLEKGWTARS